MLKVLRQGQRWIMGFVILVVGGVFVAFVGVGGPLFRRGGAGGDTIVEVDGHRFGSRDLLRVRSQQEAEAKRMLGDSFDPKALSSQLDLMAANALVQGGILAREAERLGLRVGDDEIVEVVKQIPAFKDEQGRSLGKRWRRSRPNRSAARRSPWHPRAASSRLGWASSAVGRR